MALPRTLCRDCSNSRIRLAAAVVSSTAAFCATGVRAIFLAASTQAASVACTMPKRLTRRRQINRRARDQSEDERQRRADHGCYKSVHAGLRVLPVANAAGSSTPTCLVD